MRRRAHRWRRREALNQVLHLYKLAVDAAARGEWEWLPVLGRHIDRMYLKYRLKPVVRRRELVCKKCKNVNIPGVTTRVRIRRASGMTYILYTCRNCGYQWKRIVRHKGRKYKGRRPPSRLYSLAWNTFSQKTLGVEEGGKPEEGP